MSTSAELARQLTDILEKADSDAKQRAVVTKWRETVAPLAPLVFASILRGLKEGWRKGSRGMESQDKDYDRWSFLHALDMKEGFWARDFIDDVEAAESGYEYYGGMFGESRHYPKLSQLSSAVRSPCPDCGQEAVGILQEKHVARVSDTSQPHLLCVNCQKVIPLTKPNQEVHYRDSEDRFYGLDDD